MARSVRGCRSPRGGSAPVARLVREQQHSEYQLLRTGTAKVPMTRKHASHRRWLVVSAALSAANRQSPALLRKVCREADGTQRREVQQFFRRRRMPNRTALRVLGLPASPRLADRLVFLGGRAPMSLIEQAVSECGDGEWLALLAIQADSRKLLGRTRNVRRGGATAQTIATLFGSAFEERSFQAADELVNTGQCDASCLILALRYRQWRLALRLKDVPSPSSCPDLVVGWPLHVAAGVATVQLLRQLARARSAELHVPHWGLTPIDIALLRRDCPRLPGSASPFAPICRDVAAFARKLLAGEESGRRDWSTRLEYALQLALTYRASACTKVLVRGYLERHEPGNVVSLAKLLTQVSPRGRLTALLRDGVPTEDCRSRHRPSWLRQASNSLRPSSLATK